MATETFDVIGSDQRADRPKKTEGGGWRVSVRTAVLLVCLVLGVMVIVAVVAVFVKSWVFECSGTDNAMATNGQQAVGMCNDWIQKGGLTADRICRTCPVNATSTKPHTTQPMTSPPARTTTSPHKNYKLPTSVVPSHYALRLKADIYGQDPRTFSFQGSVTIDVTCRHSTDVIVMHSEGLQINDGDVEVLNKSGAHNMNIMDISYEKETAFVKIRLDRSLVAEEEYQIKFNSFTGRFVERAMGLHIGSYVHKKEIIYGVQTRAGFAHARKIFPCFDEPALKATFDVTLARKTNAMRRYATLSTMSRQREKQISKSWAEDVYERSPVMSTYSLAFSVCDYVKLSSLVNEVQMTVWVRPTVREEANAFHDFAERAFTFADSRFIPSYNSSINKLDFVVSSDIIETVHIPWGLVFLEENVLYSEKRSDLKEIEYSRMVISNRIMYMWLTSLVSPKGWESIDMLNAINNFYAFHIVDELHPQGEGIETTKYQVFYLSRDALSSARPLVMDPDSQRDIQSIPDADRNLKGVFVARMLHFVMGDDKFVEAINTCLQNNKYGSVDNKDLWDAFNKVMMSQSLPVDIALRFEPWMREPGHPVVTVKRSRRGKLQLYQKRFLVGAESDAGIRYKHLPHKWHIPITMTSSKNPNFNQTHQDITWMDTNRPLTLPDPTAGDSDAWFILNTQWLGFYRVNYDRQNWQALIKQLNTDHTVIDPLNRAQIIIDSLHLAESRMLDMSLAFQTLDYLPKEDHSAPWRAFFSVLEKWEHLMDRTELFGDLEVLVLHMVSTSLQKLGFSITPGLMPSQISVRKSVIEHACRYGFPKCVSEAKKEILAWKNSGKNSMNPNVRETYYCAAVREGSAEDWEFILDKYTTEEFTNEKLKLLKALACSKEPYLLNRLLSMTLEVADIKVDAVPYLFDVIGNNRWAYDIVFQFILENLDKLSQRLGISTTSYCIFYVSAHLKTKYHFEQIRQLEKADVTSSFVETTQIMRAHALANQAWLTNQYDDFKQWLKSKRRPQ